MEELKRMSKEDPDMEQKPCLKEKTLTVTAWVGFFYFVMLLPLVGPTGARVQHVAANKLAFSAVGLAVALLAYGAFRVSRGETPKRSLFVLSIVAVVMVLLGDFGGFAI